MNLHSIASNAIGSVNPFIDVVITRNQGYTTDTDGTRSPITTTINGNGQFQNLSAQELQQINGLNLEADLGAFYLNGNFDGVVRGQDKGGDIFTFNGQNWLVVQVLENWPDWSKMAICYQGEAE